MYLVDENVWNRPSKSKELADKGYTPLHYAAQFGHDAIVKVILQNVNDTMPRTGDGTTPLHYAAQFGHDAIVKVLLQNVNETMPRTSDGTTPLHLSSQYGRRCTMRRSTWPPFATIYTAGRSGRAKCACRQEQFC